MNLYKIGVVTTGLMGIWLLVTGLSGAINLIGFALINQFSSGSAAVPIDWLRLAISGIVTLLVLVPGVLIVSYRRQITRTWLLVEFEPDVPEIRESVIAKVAFALFGLSLIARGAHIVLFSAGRLINRPRISGNLAFDLLVPLTFVIAGYLIFRFASPLARRFSDEPRTRSTETR